MDLIDYKPKKQREILKTLGEQLIQMSKTGHDNDVEVTLEHIQQGYLDVLGPEDFFGSEGWQHWLNLE